jgi:hypothetical protein
MLPAIVNANLARGSFKLFKKAIFKRLDSTQNIGALSLLCSDKVSAVPVLRSPIVLTAIDWNPD